MGRKHAPIPRHLRTPVMIARQVIGLSYVAISDEIGCAPGTVSDIENGNTDPYLSTLVDLGAQLGLKLAWVPDNDAGGRTLADRLATMEADAMSMFGRVRAMLAADADG